MGAATSVACTQPVTSQEEYRLPWALTQAERFESEDCPFCAVRRSHCAFLKTEIIRLSSEVASLQTTIPPKLVPDLDRQLEESPLPHSCYTGGVDDVRGFACPKCVEIRNQVFQLQREARDLDSQCKARIDFHRTFALRIESLLMEKRRIEAQLFFSRRQGGANADQEVDGHFCAITRVNEPDEEVHALEGVIFVHQTAPADLFGGRCASSSRTRSLPLKGDEPGEVEPEFEVMPPPLASATL